MIICEECFVDHEHAFEMFAKGSQPVQSSVPRWKGKLRTRSGLYHDNPEQFPNRTDVKIIRWSMLSNQWWI